MYKPPSKPAAATSEKKRAEKQRLIRLINDTRTKIYTPPKVWVRRNEEVKSKDSHQASPLLEPAKDAIPDEARLKYAGQLAPLYNKGPMQLITGPDLVRDIGKKTSQLED